jgi:hypothetical protein
MVCAFIGKPEIMSELASDLRPNYHEIRYQNPLTFPAFLPNCGIGIAIAMTIVLLSV